jgi:hypothetical protein
MVLYKELTRTFIDLKHVNANQSLQIDVFTNKKPIQTHESVFYYLFFLDILIHQIIKWQKITE